jgi:hypothetical protein
MFKPQIQKPIVESKGSGEGGNPCLALPTCQPETEAKALGDSPLASLHLRIWR